MDERHWWCSRPSSIDVLSHAMITRKIVPTVIMKPHIVDLISYCLTPVAKSRDYNTSIAHLTNRGAL